MKSIKVADFRVEGKRVVVKDSRGRLWERFGDMPSGQWGQIELPAEPDEARAGKRSKKGAR